MRVLCYDTTFANAQARDAFQAKHPLAICPEATEAPSLADEIRDTGIEIDAVISNHVHPIVKAAIDEISVDDLRATFEAVLVFPVQLAQCLLPRFKARRRSPLVFVTSARPLRPVFGFAVPTLIRASATAIALALSREVASFRIQVNVVAPNYLYSEMYYPHSDFIDEPAAVNSSRRPCQWAGLAIAVHHALFGQDPVGDHQIAQCQLKLAHDQSSGASVHRGTAQLRVPDVRSRAADLAEHLTCPRRRPVRIANRCLLGQLAQRYRTR